MRGFTASSRLGIVRVAFPETGIPIVRKSGQVIAEGVPEVVPRGTDDGRLVVFTGGQWEGRTGTDGTPYARTSTIFVGPEGSLWGARLNDVKGIVRGWQFTDGESEMVEWAVDLTTAPRRCCGKSGPPPAPTIELPALAWEME